jgi:hypothetical protein
VTTGFINGLPVTVHNPARVDDVMIVQVPEYVDMLDKGRDQPAGYAVGTVARVRRGGIADRLYISHHETLSIEFAPDLASWWAPSYAFRIFDLRRWLRERYLNLWLRAGRSVLFDTADEARAAVERFRRPTITSDML